MNKKFKDGWEIIPADSNAGLFMEEGWMEEENLPLKFKIVYSVINKEQQIIHDILKLFIPGEYGYYFSEAHEHDEPDDIPYDGCPCPDCCPTGRKYLWERVYYTPPGLVSKTGEYNIISVAYTEDYTYYAISLHGCSLASALTEYVRIKQ